VADLPDAAFGPAAEAFAPAIMAVAEAAELPAELALPTPDRLLTPRLAPYKLKNIRIRHIREGQTLLVTGGARGVTAATLKEMARSINPHLVILGRTPLPASEPKWLENLKDEAAIREALWDRAQVKPGPLELARESRHILAGREVRSTLQALEKAGARVTYLADDFRNPETLRAVLARVRRDHGPVHGFIHGAGVLADGLILDKKDEDFDQVFDTKARMAELILEELASEPLNLVAFFSSSTARFGRRGQADYAAGNEVLNKLARAQAGTREGPKCLSVNWGPWDGGMVDAALKRLFENEGIGLIPLGEGTRLFTSLLGTPKNDPVEVVVLGPDTDLTALAGT
jgi:NAD(P)-dependent dehydrogenase (short-subunit alcohol dehydrogenase family)